MSVKITCLGWHWYPYRYSRTVDDGDGRAVARFLTGSGRSAVERSPRQRSSTDEYS